MPNGLDTKLTWVAILCAIVLLVPGLIVGGFAAALYRFFLPDMNGSIFNWLSNGWVNKLFFAIFPNIIHGGVAGGLSMVICGRLIHRANYESVAYALAAVLVVITGISMLLIAGRNGFTIDLIAAASQTGGMITGTFLMLKHVKDDIARRYAQTSAPVIP